MSAYDGIETRDLEEAHAHCRDAFASLDGANIFVTGGTGFFGRWLLALIAHVRREVNVRATVLTRDPDAFRASCPDLAACDAFTFKRGDVRYFEFPKGRFTHVIHAATDTSVAADADAANLMESIVEGTKRVLEFAAAAGVSRLLYVSSGAVYGPQPQDLERIPETYGGAPDPLDPRSGYGQAKRLAEQMCVCAGAKGRLEPVVARAFAFVGPCLPLDAHFAIGNFIRDAEAGRDIVVAGDGTPLRSYLYVGDLAAWLVTLLVKGGAGQAYNVGSDAAVGIADLARNVARLTQPSPSVIVKGKPSPDAPRARYVPNIDKARALGLDVWTSLDDAIRRMMAFARKATAKPASSHRNEHGGEKLTFVIDIDGVVAGLVPDNDYAKAEPLSDTIAAINALYDKGHRIVMMTARGSATGIDWREVTEDQFARWGLRYHELRFGKPAADYYVDDRLMPISALQAMAKL
jgi:nucleoside-diphosphate-sugar epimerase